MSFMIGNTMRSPFTLSNAIASTVAPVTAGVLKTVAGSLFEGGKLALGAAGMMSMAMGNPIGYFGAQMASGALNMAEGATFGAIDYSTMAAMGRGVPFSNFAGNAYLPSIYNRGPSFAGNYASQMYSQLGVQNYAQNAVIPNGVYSNGMPAGVPLNPYTAYQGQAATAASATANNGFMPTGNSSLDLANSIANSPTYSPAEQSLLNQITDPKQRAMQELQMQMQKQALLATMLSNIANMRHEMLKTVANNLRA